MGKKHTGIDVGWEISKIHERHKPTSQTAQWTDDSINTKENTKKSHQSCNYWKSKMKTKILKLEF